MHVQAIWVDSPMEYFYIKHKQLQPAFAPAAAEVKTSEVLIILQPINICANTATVKHAQLSPVPFLFICLHLPIRSCWLRKSTSVTFCMLRTRSTTWRKYVRPPPASPGNSNLFSDKSKKVAFEQMRTSTFGTPPERKRCYNKITASSTSTR